MSGYHIEALAIEIFKNYEGPRTYSKMLTYFCNKARERVLKPMSEITGQSDFIDSNLGGVNSETRKKLSSYLGRTVRKMNLANSSSSIDDWVKMLE